MTLKIGSIKWLGSSQLTEGEPKFDQELFLKHLPVPEELRQLRGSKSKGEIESLDDDDGEK